MGTGYLPAQAITVPNVDFSRVLACRTDPCLPLDGCGLTRGGYGATEKRNMTGQAILLAPALRARGIALGVLDQRVWARPAAKPKARGRWRETPRGERESGRRIESARNRGTAQASLAMRSAKVEPRVFGRSEQSFRPERNARLRQDCGGFSMVAEPAADVSRPSFVHRNAEIPRRGRPNAEHGIH